MNEENDPIQQAVAKQTVLIVDDEEDLKDMCVRFLERRYNVLSATSGPQALEIAEQHPCIDVLFTDVMMVPMNGRELAETLEKRIPGLIVVFASGYTSGILDDKTNFYFIQKPYSCSEALQFISDVLAKRQK